MWTLPFLNSHHQYPLTTFYQEWWSVLFGVLALSTLITKDYWQNTTTPRIIQLPIALLVIIFIQHLMGKIVHVDQATLFALYLLFASTLILLGAKLRDDFGLNKIALILACFLVINSEINALIGLQQHFRWDTPLNSYAVIKLSASVYGNIAQPNHYANYLSLGLISLGLLLQQKRINAATTLALSIPLLITLTLSGSRSAWLYLLAMAILAVLMTWQNKQNKALLHYCLLLIGGFITCHFIVQLPFMEGTAGSTNSLLRTFAQEASSGSIRLYLWKEAILILQQNPLLGAGFGQFAWQHFQLLPTLQDKNISGLYNNAHNLPLQLAAETGLIGLTIFFGSIALWIYGTKLSKPIASEHWWGYSILVVLAIHSLLEYPLWYSYFLAIAAFMLGAMDNTRYQLKLPSLGRFSMLCVILIGVSTLVQLRIQYQQLENIVSMRSNASNLAALQKSQEDLVALHEKSIFSPYTELFISALIEVSSEQIQNKLDLNTRAMRFAPVSMAAYHQTLLQAQAEQLEAAKITLTQAIWSYPNDYPWLLSQLKTLAEKDPAHFSALLEFAPKKYQEYLSAVRNK